MTVSSITRKAGPFNGNGVTTDFPFAFKVFDESDVLVVRTDPNGVETELALTTDYTIALNADQNASPGGTITLLAPPAASYRVTATSQVPNLQETDITNNGGFYPQVMEDAHDRAVIQIQQLVESVNRSMVMPLSSDLASFRLSEGATAVGRADRVIGFDADGNPTLHYASGSTQVGIDLADGALGKGASLVALHDANGDYAASTVEAAFAEIAQSFKAKTSRVVDSIAALKALDKTKFTRAFVTGYYAAGDGGGGAYWYDSTDTTSADNGVTIIVATDGARWKLIWNGFLFFEQCGAMGDGTTDDTASIQAGIDYLYGIGGGVLRGAKRYLIDGNLTIKDGVSLVGGWLQPGEQLPASTANYDGLRSVLLINSAATITVADAGGVAGFIVMRKGLDLPFADATAASTGIAAFAGTAFTVGGADTYFGHLLFLGFAMAISSNGYERIRGEYISGDCTSGIQIANCADIAYLRECHFWPFTTVHQSWTTNALLRRTGNAFKCLNVGDWNKLTNCFSYGYFRGFWSSSCNSMTFDGCGADNTSTAGVGDHAGALGFVVDGTSNDPRFANCQAAAQATGYYLALSAGKHARLVNSDAWASSSSGIDIVSGDATIIGGVLRDMPNGISVDSGASVVSIDLVRFSNISSAPIAVSAANSSINIGRGNDYGDWPAGTSVTNNANKVQRSVASADPLALPVNGDYFQITGTTNFGTLNGGWAGREVTLKFSGILTVNDGGASMKLNGNFTTSADDTLTLRHDGTAWFEVARSAN